MSLIYLPPSLSLASGHGRGWGGGEEVMMLMVVDQLVEIKSLEHSLDCGFSQVASEQRTDSADSLPSVSPGVMEGNQGEGGH